MNFFTELSKHLAGFDLKITLAKKGEKITAGIFPEHKDSDISAKLKPIIATGTAEELDAEFVRLVTPVMETATGIVTNIEGYNTELKALEQTTKEKVEKKKAAPSPAPKKAEAKKPAPKKPEAKKPAAAAAPAKASRPGGKEGKTLEAQSLVEATDKNGGLPKAKVAELRAMVQKVQKVQVPPKTTAELKQQQETAAESATPANEGPKEVALF